MKSLFTRLGSGAVICGVVLLAACGGNPDERKRQHVARGNQYLEQKQYREAILEYRNAVALDERFGEARAKLADAYARDGNAAGAFGEYVRAADLLPNDAEIQLTAGEYLLIAGRFEEARTRADAALRTGTQTVRALVLQGNALAGLKEFEAAKAKLEEAIQLDPKRRASYTSLGAMHLARGDVREAEATFQRAIAVDPSSIPSRLALASFYWSADKRTDAEAALRTAYEMAPDDPAVNRELAAFMAATGRSAEAERYLLAIAEKTPGVSAEVALADYYLTSSRPREAIARLQPVVAANPSAATAKYVLARAHAEVGDRAKAHELVDELLRKTPADPDVLVLQAELLLADGKRDAAFDRAKAAAEANPRSVRAQLALGRLYAARGDVAGAESAFAAVQRLDPRAGVAELELAKLQLASGGGPAALQRSREALARAPGSLDARLALVRSLLATGDLARADAEIAALRTTHPDTAAVVLQAGTLAAARKDFVRARQAFARALEIEPENIEALAGLVGVDVASGSAAQAKARLEARLQATPNRSDLLLLAARTSLSAADLQSAERFLRRAIDLDSSLLPAYSMLGELYLRQNRLDQAAAEFETLARRQTRPVAALTMAGIILQTQGKNELARERYERALGIDADAGVAANNLAWIVADGGGDLDVALNLAQTAIAAMPTSAKARDTLGWIYYRKGLFELAIPEFRESARLDPQGAVYHYHLGLAYWRAGKAAEAKQTLERALKAGTDFPGVEDARRILKEASRG